MSEQFFTGLPAFTTLAILASVAFVAGVMRAFSGFGGGLLIAPIYSLFVSPSDVVVLVLVLNLLTTVQLLPDILPNVQWRTVLRLLVPAFVGVPIGVFFLHWLDPGLMRKAIALIVMSMAVLMLLGWRYRGRHSRLQDGIVGIFSGFLTSIGGVGGPPVILYLLSDTRLSGAAFRAISLMLFFLLQMLTLFQIGLTGAMNRHQAAYVLILLPVYVIAHWVGARAYRRYGQQQAQFKRLALWFLLLVGLLAFFV